MLTPATPLNCVSVVIVGDSHPESVETFDIQLTTNVSRVILDPNTVSIYIQGSCHVAIIDQIHWGEPK